VSVKTRIGYGRKQTEEWIEFLLTHNLDALTVHGLTGKELYKKPADWDEIKKAVDVRQKLGKKTMVIGNGNVTSYARALERQRQSGVDGIMIGRGILSDINCFDPEGKILSHAELLTLLVKHLELFEATHGEESPGFATMKKYFRLYVRDFEGSSSVRERLMNAKTVQEAKRIVREVSEKTEI
jgi:tRNA-dihydrouridine synthase